jgi:hypothetical protein
LVVGVDANALTFLPTPDSGSYFGKSSPHKDGWHADFTKLNVDNGLMKDKPRENTGVRLVNCFREFKHSG